MSISFIAYSFLLHDTGGTYLPKKKLFIVSFVLVSAAEQQSLTEIIALHFLSWQYKITIFLRGYAANAEHFRGI